MYKIKIILFKLATRWLFGDDHERLSFILESSGNADDSDWMTMIVHSHSRGRTAEIKVGITGSQDVYGIYKVTYLYCEKKKPPRRRGSILR